MAVAFASNSANNTNVFSTSGLGGASGDAIVITYIAFATGTISAPDGTWTLVDSIDFTGGDTGRIYMWWKPLTGAPAASYTVGRASTNYWDGGMITVVTGCNNSAYHDKGKATGSSGTMSTGAVVDSPANGGLIMGGVTEGASMSTPSGMTQVFELDGGDAEGWTQLGALTGATKSSTLGSSLQWGTVWVTFAPSGGATPASLTLGQVDGVASPTLTISTKGLVVPGRVDGIAAPTLALRSPHKLGLSQIDGVAVPQATVSTKGFIVPGQVDGVAVPSLSAIVTLPYLTLGQVDGVASLTAAVISRALLALGQVDGVANTTAALKSPYLMTLSADGVASLINTLSTKAGVVPGQIDGVATAAAEVETPALAGTLTVYAENDDGYIFSSDTGADWTKIKAATGDVVLSGTSNTIDYLGIRGGASSDDTVVVYLCRFDTSSLPDGASIASVTFSLYGTSGAPSDTTDTLEARIYDWGAAITTADWKDPTAFSALTRVATKAVSSWNESGYNDFTEDGTNFRGAVNKTGYTYLYVATSQFAAGTVPTETRGVLHYNANEGDPKRPKLVVNYTAPVTITPGQVDGVATVSNLLVKSKSLLTMSQVDGVATVAAAVDTTGGAINPQTVAGVATAAATVISRVLMAMQADGVAAPTALVSTKAFVVPGQVDGIATAAVTMRSAAQLAIAADGTGSPSVAVSSKALLTMNADGSASPVITISARALLGNLQSSGVAGNELSLTIVFRPRVRVGAGVVRQLPRWGGGIVVSKKNQAGWVVRSGKMVGGTVS